MLVNAATAVCRCLPFKVLMPIFNMLFPLLRVIYQISPFPRKSAAPLSTRPQTARPSARCHFRWFIKHRKRLAQTGTECPTPSAKTARPADTVATPASIPPRRHYVVSRRDANAGRNQGYFQSASVCQSAGKPMPRRTKGSRAARKSRQRFFHSLSGRNTPMQ